jgi:hypothetical protein
MTRATHPHQMPGAAGDPFAPSPSVEATVQRMDRATFAAVVVGACLVGAALAFATDGWLPFAEVYG